MDTIRTDTEDWFKERIGRLTPDAQRRFGTMDPPRMMRHLRLSLEASLGQTDLPDKSIPIVRNIAFWTITRLITTWPGGALKAPGFWSPPAEGEFEEERTRLLEMLGQFTAELDRNPALTHRHPMLGPLTLAQWSRLLGLHFKHHFRQFNVL